VAERAPATLPLPKRNIQFTVRILRIEPCKRILISTRSVETSWRRPRRAVAAGDRARIGFRPQRPSNRVSLAAVGVGGRGSSDCQQCFLPLEDVRFVAAVDCRKSRREGSPSWPTSTIRPRTSARPIATSATCWRARRRRPGHQHAGPLARAPWPCMPPRRARTVREKPLGVAMAWAWKLARRWPGTRWSSSTARNNAATSGSSAGRASWCATATWARSSASMSGPRHVAAIQCASVPPYGSTKPIDVPAIWIMKCGSAGPMKPYTADRATNFGA